MTTDVPEVLRRGGGGGVLLSQFRAFVVSGLGFRATTSGYSGVSGNTTALIVPGLSNSCARFRCSCHRGVWGVKVGSAVLGFRV